MFLSGVCIIGEHFGIIIVIIAPQKEKKEWTYNIKKRLAAEEYSEKS